MRLKRGKFPRKCRDFARAGVISHYIFASVKKTRTDGNPEVTDKNQGEREVLKKLMEMKKSIILLLLVLLPICMDAAPAKQSQNLKVWGDVQLADDGNLYLTLYKNNPAEADVTFHFTYNNDTKSDQYHIIMPDTIAVMVDSVPLEQNVKNVNIDKVVWRVQKNDYGVRTTYETENGDDPLLARVMVDLFDAYSDIFFWGLAENHASYYRNHGAKMPAQHAAPDHSTRANSTSPFKQGDLLNMESVDDLGLVLGITAVAAASVGMGILVHDAWNTDDDRFPYVSLTPKVQYSPNTGTLRNVIETRTRFGRKGGWSLRADMGYTTGSMIEDCFDPGFTYSIGAGLDLGNFSTTFQFKPKTHKYSENFTNFVLGYNINLSRHFALDLNAGVGLFDYEDEIYCDFPLSMGLQVRL